MAWEKGIMPRAGGYLAQPRWWRRLIRFLNSRHNPISAAHWASKGDGQAQDGGTDNWIEDGEDLGAPLSFDRLKG